MAIPWVHPKKIPVPTQSRTAWMSTIDAVDGFSTGIVMCYIAVISQEQRMSAIG